MRRSRRRRRRRREDEEEKPRVAVEICVSRGFRDEEEKKDDPPQPMLSDAEDTQKTAEVVDDTEKK